MDKELLLYNYFSNQLSKEEGQQFNELLKTDADFKAQFDFESDLKRAIKMGENEELKAKLVGFEDEVRTTLPMTDAVTGSRKRWFRNWSIAASIVILMGLGWLVYNTMGTNYDDLYASNFEQYPNTVYAITRGDEGDSSLERRAFVAYETDENKKAIELFEELKATEASENVTFFLAQSYLKNQQPKEAIVLLEEVIQGKGEFVPQALWYSALAYLKTDQKENAVKALNTLIADGRFKKEGASILLDKVE